MGGGGGGMAWWGADFSEQRGSHGPSGESIAAANVRYVGGGGGVVDGIICKSFSSSVLFVNQIGGFAYFVCQEWSE